MLLFAKHVQKIVFTATVQHNVKHAQFQPTFHLNLNKFQDKFQHVHQYANQIRYLIAYYANVNYIVVILVYLIPTVVLVMIGIIKT